MTRQLTVSILPSVNGRKRHDYYATKDVGSRTADVGAQVSLCLQALMRDGIDPREEQVVFEVKVF
jgi:hypothetical protein